MLPDNSGTLNIYKYTIFNNFDFTYDEYYSIFKSLLNIYKIGYTNIIKNIQVLKYYVQYIYLKIEYKKIIFEVLIPNEKINGIYIYDMIYS